MTDRYTTEFYTELTSGHSPGAGGQLFYVDPNAPPGGDGMSEGSAWNSWDQVSAFAESSGFQPGDSILLRRGCTFDSGDGFWLMANGTSDQPITVGAYGSGAPPVLTNSHFVPDANHHDTSIDDAVLNIDQSSSFIVIRDIRIDNPTYTEGNVTDAGIRVLGTNVTIDNVEIANTGTGVWFGRNAASNSGAPTESAHGLVQNCSIHDLHMVRDTAGGDDDYGCVGVLVMASDVTIVHNSFRDLMAPSHDYGWDGSAVELYGTVHNCTVTGNYIENVNAVTESGGRSMDAVSDVWFDHNIIVNSESLAYFHNGDGPFGVGSFSNVNFINNTVSMEGNRPDSFSFGFGFDGPNANFLNVENNIFAIEALDYWNIGASDFRHAHNLYDFGAIPFPANYFTLTEYIDEATFRDPGARDFRLTPISTALGRAVPINGALTDYLGHDLTGRSDLDLGAVEYWPEPGQIVGGSANDSLVGSAAADEIWGLSGNDILNGGGGADTLIGGLGNDIFYVDQAGDHIVEVAGQGTDEVRSAIAYTLGANVENLRLTGTAGIAGSGNALNNLLWGNGAANMLAGLDGDDTLYGYDGNDILDGGAGDDYLLGGTGDDTLIGGAGDDRMAGGAGNDTYYINDAADTVTEYAGEGRDRAVASIDYQLRAYTEELELSGSANLRGWGNADNNLMIGNGGDNRLYGRDGNDRLEGGAGNDTLYGENGDDTLIGGAGDDRMAGGAGNDTYYINDAADTVTEYAGEGRDRAVASIDYQLRAYTEELELSGSANLRGWGNADNNLMIGNGGDNRLYGRDGNDRLEGGAGNDTLYGENGDDTLIGGAGQDWCYGGSGADRFIVADGHAAGLSSSTCDRIMDFSQAQSDLIDLANIDADSGLAGDQSFTFLGAGAFTGHAGELRCYQAGGNTYVQGDVNGDGVGDFLIRLDGLHTLHASDFFF